MPKSSTFRVPLWSLQCGISRGHFLFIHYILILSIWSLFREESCVQYTCTRTTLLQWELYTGPTSPSKFSDHFSLPRSTVRHNFWVVFSDQETNDSPPSEWKWIATIILFACAARKDNKKSRQIVGLRPPMRRTWKYDLMSILHVIEPFISNNSSKNH